MDFLVQLTPKEKLTHYCMGLKVPTFFATTAELARQNPNLLPAIFNLPEFEKDVQDHKHLSDVLVQIKKLEAAVQDTVVALEQECMRTSLFFYKQSQAAADQNYPGVATIVDRL